MKRLRHLRIFTCRKGWFSVRNRKIVSGCFKMAQSLVNTPCLKRSLSLLNFIIYKRNFLIKLCILFLKSLFLRLAFLLSRLFCRFVFLTLLFCKFLLLFLFLKASFFHFCLSFLLAEQICHSPAVLFGGTIITFNSAFHRFDYLSKSVSINFNPNVCGRSIS